MLKPKKFNWSIFANEKRVKAIEDIKSIISSHGGYIINFNLFSDLAMTLTVEIEESHILELYDAINTHFSITQIKPENINLSSAKDCWVLMNINFSQGKGELTNIVHDSPG